MKLLLQSLVGLERYRLLSQSFNATKRLIRPRHEPEVQALSGLVNRGDLVFEVGANYAQYSRVLSRLVGPEGRVYAFEPAAITYRCLERNCRWLRLGNVAPQRLALSDSSGEMTLHTPVKRRGVFGVAQASLAPDPGTDSLSESVSTETMDGFVARHRLGRVAFIRCDVEGAEMNVFLGGDQTLRTHRPRILVEVHPRMMERYGHSLSGLQAHLRRLGYGFAVWRDGTLAPAAGLLPGNVFCLPGN